MKKVLLFFAMIIVLGSAKAYDFSAVSPSGHTLYYTIENWSDGYCVWVTHPRENNSIPDGYNYYSFDGLHNSLHSSYYNYYSGFTKPTGDLIIPDSVTYEGTTYPVSFIDACAFFNCDGLTSVHIPNTIVHISQFAFALCYSLSTINIPDGTSLNVGSFFCCNISTINSLANNRGFIHEFAFAGCPLTSIVLPNRGGGGIGRCAFSHCIYLNSITIGDSVQWIDEYAFENCTSLVSITIPESVYYLSRNAFTGCTSLSTVNYLPAYCEYIENSGKGPFEGLTGITTLNIGNEVQIIPSRMFKGCTGLVSLNIPDAVTEIADGAFTECSNLTSATIGNGVSSIGNNAFAQCTRLTNVSLGESIETIGNSAFQNCGIIGELVIPQGVISIGNNGFKDCFGITEITCLGRVAPTLGTDAFDGVDTSITVNIPCGTTNLYAGRWSYFHNFNEIPFLFNVASADVAQGTVAMLQEPTCEDPVAIVEATPRNGYRFDHWSDGSTANPYTYTAMGSLTLTAYFASTTDGIDDIETDGIRVYVVDGRIIVEGAENETVRVFDLMGLCVGDNCSQRLTTGVYLVKVGSLPARKVVVIK